MNEVAMLDIKADAPIDMVFDHTNAAPVPPTLKILIFTKTMGAAIGTPNLHVWRFVPGDPKHNAFLQQVKEAIPEAWMDSMRVSPKLFKSQQEADQYLDELRAKKPGSDHY